MSEVKCLRCGTAMEDYGIQRLRIGRVIGEEGSHILGDMEGESWPIQVHICPKCGNVELTATRQTGARLLSRKGLKKCVNCGREIPLAAEQCPFCGAEQKEK